VADETRTAQVDLKADVSGYTAGTSQAYAETNKLNEAINKLTTSLDGITKRAGKKLLIFSAADTAAMTAMVAITAKYEKQLSTLRAQSEIGGKSLVTYKKGIDDIAKALPITRGEVTQLVTQIHELGVTSETEGIKMARVFTKLAGTTGEDIGSLTQSMLELSRQMGTLGNGSQSISNFADSLVSVSAKSGVSATSVLNFAQAIAPMARAAGIGQKEVIGISAAFTRAGADGYAAANTFQQIVSDIARQTQSGSPELAKYSNAVGVTMDEFKKMEPAERVVQLFESVTKAGPNAVRMLDRLGFDGIRAAKSIQAVANQAGGLRSAIQESIGSYGQGANEKGADAAFNSLDATTTKIKNELEQIGSSIGEGVMPFAKALAETMERTLSAINKFATPLLVVAGAIGAIVAPISAAFGGIMTMMGPLSTLMLAMTAMRLTPLKSMFQGVREGIFQARGGEGILTAAGGNMARGTLADGRPVPVHQRVPFMQGNRVGQWFGRTFQPTPVGTGLAGFGRAAVTIGSDLSRSLTEGSRILYQNAALTGDRAFLRRSFTGSMIDSTYGATSRLWGNARDAFRSPGPEGRWATFRGLRTPMDMPGEPGPQQGRFRRFLGATGAAAMSPGTDAGPIKAFNESMAKTAAANVAAAAGQTTHTATVGASTKAYLSNAATVRGMTVAVAKAAQSLAMIPLSAAKMGLANAGAGLMTAGKGALGMIGGMVGMSTGAGAAILGLGVGAYAAKQAVDSSKGQYDPDKARNLLATNTELGIATDPIKDFASAVSEAANSARVLSSVFDAMDLTASEKVASRMGEMVDKNVENLRNTGEAIAYLKSMGKMNPQQARSLQIDMYRKFGEAGGDEIRSGYLSQTQMGSKPYGSGVVTSLLTGAKETQQDTNWNAVLRGGNPFADQGAKDQTTAAVNSMMSEWSDITQTKGNEAGGQVLATRLREGLDAVLGDTSETGQVVRQQFISEIERSLLGGSELGTSTLVMGGNKGQMTMNGTLGVGGDIIGTSDEFFSALEGNGTDAAARLRDILKGNNTSSGAQKRLDELLALNPLSDSERKLRSTDLGKFSRDNATVYAATEGGLTANPKAMFDAMNTLTYEVTKGGTAFADATDQFQQLKINVADVNNPLYQLAQSAQAAAEAQATFAARTRGGWQGAMSQDWQTAQAKINRPDPNNPGETQGAYDSQRAMQEDLKSKLADYIMVNRQFRLGKKRQDEDFERQEFVMQRDFDKQKKYADEDYQRSRKYAEFDYNQSVAYAEKDFYTQRLYSAQDFAKSMKRMNEDAAKSIYEPFQRAFNPGTVSFDQFQRNIDDQNERLIQQRKDLAKLKKRGMSQETIDMYGLDQTAQSFQVSRWADGQLSEEQLAQLEKSTKKRQTETTKATANTQNVRRTEEDYWINLGRGEKEFEKVMTRGEKAYKRSLRLSEVAYEISLTRSQDAYDTSVADMNKAFKLSQDRAREDLMIYGQQVTGDLEWMMKNASSILFTNLGTDATAFLNSIKTLLAKNPGMTEENPDKRPKGGVSGPGSPEYTPGAETTYTHKPGWKNAYVEDGRMMGTNSNDRAVPLPVEPKEWFAMSDKEKAALFKRMGYDAPTWAVGSGGRAGQGSQPPTGHAKGGIAMGPSMSWIGEAGKELVFPLEGMYGRSAVSMLASQITTEMAKSYRTAGHSSAVAYRGGSTNVVNNNTTFRDIQVVAQDPNEMARKLKDKARIKAMGPSKGQLMGAIS
jgi:TP901 family phage tail tape measure protein